MTKKFIQSTAILTWLLLLFGGVTPSRAQEIRDGVLISWASASGAIRIPDNVTEIKEDCFYSPGEPDPDGWGASDPISNTAITSVDFNNVTKIGKNAFKGCTGLTSMVAPRVSHIATEAFEGCSLSSVSLPRIIHIENGAFANCSLLKTVSLGKTLAQMGDNPFSNTSSLTDITIESGASEFYAQQGAIIRTADGALLSVGGGVVALSTDERCLGVANKALFNCNKLTKLTLPAATTLGEKSLTGCSSLVELRMPHLREVFNEDQMTMSGVSSLQLVDIHQSPSFSTFKEALPDKETTTVYVANEVVKTALQKEFKRVRIVVGAPPGSVEQVSISFTGDSNGKVEAWTTGAVDLLSGQKISKGSRITVKATPFFDCEVAEWTLNGTPIREGITSETNTKNQLYTIESIQENTQVKVSFKKLPDGYYVFFRSKAELYGSVSCALSDGTPILSGNKVPRNATLVFTATPKRGFRVTDWLKDVGEGTSISFEVIPGTNGQLTYTCQAEDGLDIAANFDRKEGHYIVKFSSFNTENGTLSAALADGTAIKSGEAFAQGSSITFTAHPTAGNDVEEWQLNQETIPNYKKTSYTVNSLSGDIEVNLLCSTQGTQQDDNKPIVKDGHLISWKPKGAATLPDEVTHIDTGAFEGANEMTSLTLSSNTTYIAERALLYTTALIEFSVPADNKHFSTSNGVLYNKDKTVLIAYPAGKKDSNYEILASAQGIMPGCFITCPYLRGVSVASGNTHLKSEEGVLYSKDGSILYYYPISVSSTEDEKNKTVLKEGVVTLARLSMAYHPRITKLQLPASLKTIEARALSYNPRLTAVEFAEGTAPGVEIVADSAFFYSRSLLQFPYMPRLKQLGCGALALCTEMIELHIPSECLIGSHCFDKCQTIGKVFSYGTTPPSIDENAFKDILYITEAVLSVPVGAKAAYEKAAGWRIFSNIEEVEGLSVQEIDTNSKYFISTTEDGITVRGIEPGTAFAAYLSNGELICKGYASDNDLRLSFPHLRKQGVILVVGNRSIKLMLQ